MAILSIAMPDVQINPMNIAVINLADEAKLFHFVLIKFSQISPSSAKLITAIFIGFIWTSGSWYLAVLSIKQMDINLLVIELNNSQNHLIC